MCIREVFARFLCSVQFCEVCTLHALIVVLRYLLMVEEIIFVFTFFLYSYFYIPFCIACYVVRELTRVVCSDKRRALQLMFT